MYSCVPRLENIVPEPSPSPQISNTTNGTPTVTPLASPNPTPLLESTHQPAPTVQCPEPQGQVPTIKLVDTIKDFEMQILAYLNARGSALGLQAALADIKVPVNDKSIPVEAHLNVLDVTGDSTPEVVLGVLIPDDAYGHNFVFVFRCLNNQYESILSLDGQYETATQYGLFIGGLTIEVRTVQDLNKDGVPEIVLAAWTPAAGNDSVTTFSIIKWNGESFESLIQSEGYNFVEILNGDGIITDTDENGTLELVIIGGMDRGNSSLDAGPQRERTDVWAWDGTAFSLMRSSFEPPRYRFQAVLDGDVASTAGDYETALAFYQQAIFDEELLGWSAHQYPEWVYHFSSEPTPIPDPDEFARLESYSRYRIFLLHISQNYITDAQTVYTTLQNKFPAGKVGHEYAQLAATFWKEFSSRRDISTACRKVFDHAVTNGIATPFHSDFYGWSNRDYDVELTDFCPFN